MSRAGREQAFAVLFAVLMVTSMVAGTAAISGGAAADPGDVVHRMNAGADAVSSIDGGPDWANDDQYLVAGGDETSSHGQPSSIDGSVPSGTPDQIWGTERWDPSEGEEMQYEFDVPDGQQVEVRLYFYDGCTCTDAEGERVFDVSIEDQTVLSDFDIIEKYGDQTGAMESFTVTSDGTVDVDFAHVTENPQINAIEIVSAEPQADTLGGPSSVDFGTVVTGNSGTETVTLTNLGVSGDPSIDVSDVSVTGTDAGDFTAGSASQTTLAPGESANIPVTFTPSDAQAKAATLEVSHSGNNSPLTVDLSGEGVSDVPVGFGSSQLDLSGVAVDSINNPTSLQFGPDGRLYVSQQNGIIYAFEVERTASNDYEATSVETITTIKDDIPNHNDDGAYNSQNIRQVTGITVTGTASQPVLYVSSSDWRISTGNTNPPNESLDTNSGVVSKLTATDSGWDHTMLVRGLPRSEENHAPNGLALDEQNGTLYLAEGGHTNMGTPSNFFSDIPEYAYSGAILSIDLSEVKSMSEKDAANTDVQYLYDLPTLNPNQTATDGPFGGLDGDNMAVLEQSSPVQIHAPGFRNPYDVHLTEDGQLYSVDNGPNGGLGGPPTAACTAESQNGGDTYGDNLHYVSGEGYYAGHPNPVRGNADYFSGAVYDGYDGTGECDYLVPGQEDGALATFGASTNGLTEYTASNFGGAMQGDLLTSSFDGNVYRIQLNSQGDGLTEDPTPLVSSGGTLDVTAQGDSGQFPGTVWSAERTDNAIQVFEPADFGGGGDTQCDLSDPTGDADGDGYTNEDEQAVGTDPCSAGSVPADYDDDGNPDQLDNDDDNDGLSDSEDPFALDPDNGQSTQLPVELTFNPSETYPNTIPSATGGTDGLGFTGLMTNGQDPYSDLYNPDNVFAGGQAQILSVSEVPQGDAYQDQNDQQYAFQFGADTTDVSEPFTVHTTVAGFPENPESAQSAGMFIGNGDQDNYLKFVVSAADGSGGVQLATENGGTFTDVATQSDSSVTGSETPTDLFLTVDPTTDPSPDNGVDEYAVTATYTVDSGEEQTVGTTAAPAAWFTDGDQGLAVGVISTSNFASSTFSAAWEQLSVDYVDAPENQPPTADAGADQTVDEGDSVTLDASGSDDSDGDQLGYSWTQTGGPSVTLSDAAVAQPTFTAPDVGSETTLTFEVEVSDGQASDIDTVNVTVQDATSENVVLAVNAGGSNYTASDGTMYVAGSQTTVFTGGEQYSTGESIANTTDDPLYQTELYGGGSDSGAPDAPNVSAPVENGTYEVTLKFAELFQSSNDSRVFDVYVEGDQKLVDYDIYEEAGDFTATDKTYTVEVTDGELNVGFDAEADNAKIGAVKAERVGDVSPGTTSADVTVTEDSGIDSSTYGSDSFNVTNTGEESISSVQIDLSESAIPDAVFDPNGTAGDATSKGLVIDTESGDGVGVVTTDSATVFSQPHNGVDESEGYDVLTLEFTDFEAGETVTFSTDIDPTTIKGVSTTGGAGSVSGLELSGSAVSVSSSSATVTNDLYTDGSAGGSQASVTPSASAAPTLGVEGVTLAGTDFPAHEAATVSDQQQNLTLSGPAGATVNLLTIATSEPPADGYDVDAYEGDNAEVVSNQTVTLDSNGQATVPVTLDTTNLNYYQAAVQDGPSSNGAVSTTVALEYEESTAAGNTSADVALTPDSGITASTYSGGSYQVTNTGETDITTLRVDLNETVLPDMVFDPFNTAGDDVGKEFTLDSGDVTVENVEYANFHNGENNSAGYDSLVVTLSGFEPSETMTFSIDNDPTSISSTGLGSQAAGPVSGLELAGGTVSVGADETDTYEATLVGDGSAGGSQATVLNDTDETKPAIAVDNVSLSSTTISDRHTAATVSDASQTVEVTGAPANADVTLLRIEGELNLTDVPEPYDLEDYEANKAVDVQYYPATTDSTGAATVNVTLTNSTATGGLNYFVAAVEEPDGDTGPTSDYAVLELAEEPENTAPTVDSITDKGASEGESLTVEVPASDADGDALNLSVSGPSFVSADDANGTITIAPGDDTVGTYDVTVTADDGNATANESFAAYVDEPDQDGTVVEAVNAGGDEYNASDGTTYAASSNFTGGTAFSTGSSGTPSDPEIGGTEDDELYQTELYGEDFGYAVPLENGTYEVTLQFAEFYQGVSSNDGPDSDGPTDGTNENDRLFDATVEGQAVLTEYDIYSEVGPLNATDKTYTVEVTDGQLNVEFSAVNDNAKISAVKVEQIETGDDEPALDPIGEFENAPTDPDGDGLYEDVNGDGDVNVGDAQAIFSNADDSVIQNNTGAFDYNGDGDVNVGDAQALFANGLAAGDDGTEA